MIEVELTEGPGVDVPLDLRTVRGRPVPDIPARLAGRVVVGSPRARLLTPADADTDQDLRRFIEAEARTSSYYLVALSCTFVSDDQQRLADAWLRIDLDGAVAQSMEPVSLEEITELSYNIKIGVPCVINSELTVGGKKDKVESAVQALYEGTSTPAWTFTETSSRALHGLQRLRMIVRAAAGHYAQGTISVGANVRHKRLGVFPYVVPIAELPTPPRLDLRS